MLQRTMRSYIIGVQGEAYNAPEYKVGRGATTDLFILFISACMSCQKQSDQQRYSLQLT
jgi:hypothetical protein